MRHKAGNQTDRMSIIMIRFLLLLPTMLFYDVNSQLSPASDYSLSILQMLQKNTNILQYKPRNI